MRKTIVSWLVNASVAAFAVGALQIHFTGIGKDEVPTLIFSVVTFILAIMLSKEKK